MKQLYNYRLSKMNYKIVDLEVDILKANKTIIVCKEENSDLMRKTSTLAQELDESRKRYKVLQSTLTMQAER